MKKWFCSVCEYIMEKEDPKSCKICNSPQEKLKIIEDEKTLVNNKENIGIAKNTEENITSELREIFEKECLEVGTYLAMGKIAYEEGYTKIANSFKEIAYEEANHASILAELLGEVIKTNTKENLEIIINNEYEATQSKLKLAKKSKELGLDVIYNTLNTMYKEEIKHGKAFSELLNEFFYDK